MNTARKVFAALAFAVFVNAVFLNACSSKRALEDSPIITSATYQHTLYNGRGQPIEAEASAKVSKEGPPAPVITYFLSKEDLNADINGSQEAPVEVGNYFVRIRRPAGNGYRAGNDITVEYHIQRALVTIIAETRQEFVYDGSPKPVVFSVDKNVEPDVAYYTGGLLAAPITEVMNGPPTERGLYHVFISYNGDAHHMGVSKTVELLIR